ncbi:hypothetical protein MT325_m688R [Paramecium bursaria chlorella virus MT325]|uniref:Uncharacterized protein m688R n=1 Tax=Paramecium bursaria Chlorella virus MT325 TaxID=346932 RepID=A7IV68_PBCVM|nr:hypothetical protein MT325_m688R [Paramecium bursaria chlorella virus MT325]
MRFLRCFLHHHMPTMMAPMRTTPPTLAPTMIPMGTPEDDWLSWSTFAGGGLFVEGLSGEGLTGEGLSVGGGLLVDGGLSGEGVLVGGGLSGEGLLSVGGVIEQINNFSIPGGIKKKEVISEPSIVL